MSGLGPLLLAIYEVSREGATMIYAFRAIAPNGRQSLLLFILGWVYSYDVERVHPNVSL